MPGTLGTASDQRVDWVDMAKGFCIIFVVMMHSTLGVEDAAGRIGFMHYVVAFARPFRMPDFFMISGLFLARVIDRDWRTYLDRKVVHFAYFYVIWFTLQFLFKAPQMAAEQGWDALPRLYLLGTIEPFGTLWFIYLLPIFFVTAKLLRRVPPWVVLSVAAVLEILPIETGWTVIDEFAERFVYFYAGYIFAPQIFEFTARVRSVPLAALAGLFCWGVVNGLLVFADYAQFPGVALALGLVGAVAVCVFCTLLTRSRAFGWLEYIGRNSIVVYLAFCFPMALMRFALVKTGVIQDIGVVSLIVTVVAVETSLIFHSLVDTTPLRYLFLRPDWLKSERRSVVPAMQPSK